MGGQFGGVSGRQVSPGQTELPLAGTAGSHGHLDAANRGGDLGADLEQFQPPSAPSWTRPRPSQTSSANSGEKCGLE